MLRESEYHPSLASPSGFPSPRWLIFPSLPFGESLCSNDTHYLLSPYPSGNLNHILWASHFFSSLTPPGQICLPAAYTGDIPSIPKRIFLPSLHRKYTHTHYICKPYNTSLLNNYLLIKKPNKIQELPAILFSLSFRFTNFPPSDRHILF